MEKHYHHLSTTDRVTLMFLKRQGLSLRAIASELNRSPSTLSRELTRCESCYFGTKGSEVQILSRRPYIQRLRAHLRVGPFSFLAGYRLGT